MIVKYINIFGHCYFSKPCSPDYPRLYIDVNIDIDNIEADKPNIISRLLLLNPEGIAVDKYYLGICLNDPYNPESNKWLSELRNSNISLSGFTYKGIEIKETKKKVKESKKENTNTQLTLF